MPSLLLAALCGCAGAPAEPDDLLAESAALQRSHRREHAQMQREKDMKQAWVNRSYADLVAAYGQPRLTMAIPAPRPWPVSIIVYEGQDPDGDCIDAFTVVLLETSLVYDYFCR
jgi:hypothetical protein